MIMNQTETPIQTEESVAVATLSAIKKICLECLYNNQYKNNFVDSEFLEMYDFLAKRYSVLTENDKDNLNETPETPEAYKKPENAEDNIAGVLADSTGQSIDTIIFCTGIIGKILNERKLIH